MVRLPHFNGDERVETSMPPKKKDSRGLMSVNPPYEIAAAVGGYRTVVLTQGLRVLAHMLSDAAVDIAPLFSPEEWGLLAEAWQEKAIEPELPNPGYNLARIVQRAHTHYRIGDRLTGPEKKQSQLMEKLVSRLEALTYAQAWAILAACQWRWDYYKELKPEDPWWDLAFRRQVVLANPPKRKADSDE